LRCGKKKLSKNEKREAEVKGKKGGGIELCTQFNVKKKGERIVKEIYKGNSTDHKGNSLARGNLILKKKKSVNWGLKDAAPQRGRKGEGEKEENRDLNPRLQKGSGGTSK